ncbi:hypothetical protein NEF87_003988 [Candidatus Lokiarchaeum ossiferum]|uniref:Uncharacterized protein n=1 Tax=Candidatus Lokiarchaeum ossiferum TaxID=2951803 RepID=A0ABY6HWH5_9ARCH|nr:hypothetical protein NEF87_003988 [Candidatus Lokiarchaeum sp. B-35]
MKKNLTDSLKSKYVFRKLHGKFYDVKFGTEIVKIKKIYIFQEHDKKKSYLVIETSTSTFLGIILAHQSSDLLALIGKKILQEKKRTHDTEENANLIQYLLPMGNHQVKLIAFYIWTNEEQALEIIQKLDSIYEKFKQKMNIIISPAMM